MRKALWILACLLIFVETSNAQIARVNQNCFGGLVVSSNAITQALGWTTASGDFLVLQVTGIAVTFTSATASGTSMTLDATVNDGTRFLAFYSLANTGSVSSVTVNFTASNGSEASFCAAEYSGLSLTASPVNTAVTGSSGFVSTNTWTNGAYMATSGNLVLAGCGTSTNSAGTWGAGSGWMMTASDPSAGGVGVPAQMLEEQLNVSGGSFTGTGTWSQGAGGTHYVYSTVSYPAAPTGPAGVTVQSMDSFVWYLLIAALGLAHGFTLAAARLFAKVGHVEHKAVRLVRDLISCRLLDRAVLVAKA